MLNENTDNIARDPFNFPLENIEPSTYDNVVCPFSDYCFKAMDENSGADIDRSGAVVILDPRTRLLMLIKTGICEQSKTLMEKVRSLADKDRYRIVSCSDVLYNGRYISAVLLNHAHRNECLAERFKVALDTFYAPDDEILHTYDESFHIAKLMEYNVNVHGGITMPAPCARNFEIRSSYLSRFPEALTNYIKIYGTIIHGSAEAIIGIPDGCNISCEPSDKTNETRKYFANNMVMLFHKTAALWAKRPLRPETLLKEISDILQTENMKEGLTGSSQRAAASTMPKHLIEKKLAEIQELNPDMIRMRYITDTDNQIPEQEIINTGQNDINHAGMNIDDIFYFRKILRD